MHGTRPTAPTVTTHRRRFRATRVTRVGLYFLALMLLGWPLAFAYGLPSCATGCRPDTLTLPTALVSGNGLDPPVPIVLIYVIALLVNAIRSHWAIIGTVLAGLVACLYVYGESSEPFHYWANHDNNLGFSFYFIAVFVGAGGTAVEAVWELIDRFSGRHVDGAAA